MRHWQVFALGLAALFTLALVLPQPALSQGRGQGFRPCPYTPYLCAPPKALCRPLTITGKITRVFTETLQDKMQPGMAITIASRNHGQVRVHLGPVWYLERQAFDLTPGQEVQVQGVCLPEKGETRLIAAQVTVGDHVLVLRDAAGRPMWEAWRKKE
jgi:hypothetical protein